MSEQHTRTVNLAEEMKASEGLGLSIELAQGMSVEMATGKMRGCWKAAITRNRQSTSGRPAKGVSVLNLIAAEGEGPMDLLKQVIALWEHGDVEVYR